MKNKMTYKEYMGAIFSKLRPLMYEEDVAKKLSATARGCYYHETEYEDVDKVVISILNHADITDFTETGMMKMKEFYGVRRE